MGAGLLRLQFGYPGKVRDAFKNLFALDHWNRSVLFRGSAATLRLFSPFSTRTLLILHLIPKADSWTRIDSCHIPKACIAAEKSTQNLLAKILNKG